MQSIQTNRSQQSASTGAGMDTVVPRKKGKKAIITAAGACAIAAAVALVLTWIPSGLQVPQANLRIFSVARGTFLDEIAVRTNVTAFNSVILDSNEVGKVEEIFVEDGAFINKGTVLFRISNPERRLALLARQSEYAQQIANLSTLRAAFESSRIDHNRKQSELEFSLAKAEKERGRNTKLAEQGFVSDAALIDSNDLAERLRRAITEQLGFNTAEMRVRRDAITQMETAITGLQSGLKMMTTVIDALTVRAPTTGRLTDFHLQVGETIKLDQRIGRIDDPNRVKLVAQVDEYHLNRISAGHMGSIDLSDVNYPVRVTRIFPQIKDGRFEVHLTFAKEQPAGLRPGQSLDAKIMLGEPSPALLLPNAAFINDSGGTWAFVLDADGITAARRAIKIGRRSNAQIEVLSGLSVGDKVIVSSYKSYATASKLQLVK